MRDALADLDGYAAALDAQLRGHGDASVHRTELTEELGALRATIEALRARAGQLPTAAAQGA